MTNTALYYDNADQVIPVSAVFTNISGVAVDPSAVVLAVTDPHGTVTTYTYVPAQSDPNQVIKDSTGHYHLWLMPFGGLTPPPAGLWSYTWTGVGATVANGAQAFAGTFRVLPLSDVSGLSEWYCGKEELKSRLGIATTDTKDDYEIQLAIQTVTDWITTYTAQHFYRVTETRTYEPQNIWTLDIDPCVSISALNIDYDGDGVYEVHWTQGVDYQLLRYKGNYNTKDLGIERPQNYIQVIRSASNGGQWFPFLYPLTKKDRIQIQGTWGWPDIPPNVTQAALILAADLFRAKDAPYGVAGIGEYGMVRVQSNPWVVELLRGYVNMRRKVGV